MSDTFQAQSMRLVGYFPAGAIHPQNYRVADIPAAILTHVIYAFADVTAAGDCVSESAKDDAVNFPQLRELKTKFPHLKVLISVGGASHSTNFSAVCRDNATRAHVVSSCVQFMIQNGFDGIDIDWEFPGAADSANFTALLRELRSRLDDQGTADGRAYVLTIAAPAGLTNISHLQLAQIHPSLDWINLMTYDFTVASSKKTNFDAPLFATKGALNVNAAVNSYLGAGVPTAKIVMGVRFVGTGWQGVGPINNGLYQAAAGPAPGSWDPPGTAPSGSFGFQDIKDNYLPNYTRSWNGEAQVPWLYDADTGIMISYEDPQSLTAKASYVRSNQLSGVMIWELAADDDRATLLKAVASALGRPD
jgi:chitinase